MRSLREGSWRRHAVRLALLGVLVMMATPAAALEGPGLAILSHSDGDFETSRQVTVHGNATAPTRTPHTSAGLISSRVLNPSARRPAHR